MDTNKTNNGRPASITALQWEAWAAFNTSYHVPDGEAYRALGHALYVQDLHERIETLFAQLDEQNLRLDRLAVGSGQRSAIRAATCPTTSGPTPRLPTDD